MSATESTNWLTRKQAAAYLREIGYPISPGHLSNLASKDNSGKGPAFTRIGWRTVRYKREDLKKWYDNRAVRIE